jgi:hypothetical protein
VEWIQALPSWKVTSAEDALNPKDDEEMTAAAAAAAGAASALMTGGTSVAEHSAETDSKKLLAEFKAKLEAAEAKKAAAGDGDDVARRHLQARAAEVVS